MPTTREWCKCGPEFSIDGRILTSVTYASPNYDCGFWEKHRYEPDGDYFELVEYREKKRCDSKTTPPEQYPMVWTILEMGQ